MKIFNAVFLSKGHLRIILPLYLAFTPGHTGNPADATAKTNYDLVTRLSSFDPVSENATYYLSVCADIPKNDEPGKVYFRGASGHVFVILGKRDSVNGNRAQVFGFYPRSQASCVLFNNIRSVIRDNSGRIYDVSITRQLTAKEFQMVREKAAELSKHRYLLHKFNCYDFAIELFNSISASEKLPLTHLKFPFIWGRGGTPCGLYLDLEKLAAKNAAWATAIRFGTFKAPISN